MVKVALFFVTINTCISFQLAAQSSSTEALQKELNRVSEDSARLPVLNNLCHAYRYSKPAQSIVYGKEAYQLAKKLNHLPSVATACLCLGSTYFIQSTYDTALMFLQKSLAIGRQLHDSITLAHSYSRIGVILRNQGKHIQAIEYQRQALEIYQKLDDQQRVANTHSNIGTIHYKQGDLVRALKHYFAALEASDTAQRATAGIYNNIGLVYMDQKAYGKAVAYFKKALAIQQQDGNKEGTANALFNIATVFNDQQDTIQARAYYQKAQVLYRDLGDLQGEATVLLGIGDLFYKQQKYENARQLYQDALVAFEQIGQKDGIVLANHALGDVCLMQKKSRLAIGYARRSLRLSEEMQTPNFMQKSTEILYRAYQQQNNYEQAFTYLALSEQYQDTVINRQNAAKIEQLEFDHQIVKKEAENKALKVQNQLQAEQVRFQKTLRNIFITGFLVMLSLAVGLLRGKQREKKVNNLLSKQNEHIKALAADLKHANEKILARNQNLTAINKSKDKLFSVISHDLRSPLNSLYSLLALLQGNTLSPADVQKIIPEVAHQLHNSHTLLDNLLVWAKSQMQGLGPSRQDVHIRQLVEETMELLQQAAQEKEICLSNNTSETKVHVDPNMIRLVLRNLIGNAIKFTPAQGAVKVYTEETQDGYLQMAVQDTGMGIDRQTLTKLFKDIHHSSPGTRGEKGTGLGLLLSKDFIEQNGGKIWAESYKGNGSIFRFTVPISQDVAKV